MSRPAACEICGAKPAAGEPARCDSCFLAEYRHDPACKGSVFGDAWCGGPKKCGSCRAHLGIIIAGDQRPKWMTHKTWRETGGRPTLFAAFTRAVDAGQPEGNLGLRRVPRRRPAPAVHAGGARLGRRRRADAGS